MEFLSYQTNPNFYITNGKLYNINKQKPIDDVSDGYYAEELGGGVIIPICKVMIYSTGVCVEHIESGEKQVFFFNNLGKCIATTQCNRTHNRDCINIVPTNLGVFKTEYSFNNLQIHTFVDYQGNKILSHSNFMTLQKYVVNTLEKGIPDITKAKTFEEFQQALNDQSHNL